jgi:hypothetical protein
MVLQERDRHLLRELSVMRVVDREQAKLVARFGSTTRANVRLLRLTEAKLLRRFFLGTIAGGRRAIYVLTERGARAVDVPYRGLWRRRADEVLVADFFVQHQLAVNDLYGSVKYRPISVPGVVFKRWIAFSKPIAPWLPLIPDGYFEIQIPQGTGACFLEVDLGGESLTVWKEKVRNYLAFAQSEEPERLFGRSRFRVLVVANSERRMRSIRRAVGSLIDRLFWFTDVEAIRRDGFWGRTWLRLAGDDRQALIEAQP